jgi:uncharacterized protein (TIGR03792 family)
MVIEWLRFDVPAAKRAAFLKRDNEVWTAGLSRYPGFVGKELWLEAESGNVIAVIRWETLSAWKSIPQLDLEGLDAAMGDLVMPILESRAYETLPAHLEAQP